MEDPIGVATRYQLRTAAFFPSSKVLIVGVPIYTPVLLLVTAEQLVTLHPKAGGSRYQSGHFDSMYQLAKGEAGY